MPQKFTYSRYCEGCAAENPPRLIPSPRFQADHYMSATELRRLLRRKVLIAKKFKGTTFIGVNPALAQMGLELNDLRFQPQPL
jgi:hypothetical protein